MKVYVVIDEEGDPWVFDNPEAAHAFSQELWNADHVTRCDVHHANPLNES